MMRILGITLALLLLSCPAGAQEKKPEAPKPEAPKEEMKQPEPAPTVMTIEKSNKPDPCVIKPVMTDAELRACGARIPR
jgi:hypothetical protein